LCFLSNEKERLSAYTSSKKNFDKKMAKEITKSIEQEYSQAENSFRKYIKENYSDLKITKKGMPDFMVLDKKDRIIGFVEVKRTDLSDNLKKEQRIFRNFCQRYKIPYQVWMPNMATWDKRNIIKDKKIWTEQTTNWRL